MNKKIESWEVRAQEIGFAGCYPDTDKQEQLKNAERADLRAYIAELESRPAAPATPSQQGEGSGK